VSYQATAYETQRFRATLSQRIGLRFDDAKLGYLGEVLKRRIATCGGDCAAYLSELEREPSPSEISALARELTVGETYFFRNNEQFQALAEVVLPERVRVQGAQKSLRLLSAGCSSGEEAYSIAVVTRNTIDPSWKVAIRAVDVNPVALEKARRGRYSTWALRETPETVQSQWFRRDGHEIILDESLRASVAIDAANLASDDPGLWQPAAYDVIFCRNVLMYFEPQQMRAVVARIARSLAPGGFLFLGHAETLRGISDEFHLCQSHGTFYYQLHPGGDRPLPIEPRPPASETPPVVRNADWFDSIRLASERVAALLPSTVVDHPPARPPFDPTPTLELVRQERFADALKHLRAGPNASDPDPDILLLEAALLVHSGQLEAAEHAATRLLLKSTRSEAAHYVLALCREHAGSIERASEHHRTAALLDPSFAMPRLHLGLLARRNGDRQTACREFAQALALLEGEDHARLLLFGGGFGREALMALCESALKDCGGRP
jgi:chemotaxis protein methyltransferase CheR